MTRIAGRTIATIASVILAVAITSGCGRSERGRAGGLGSGSSSGSATATLPIPQAEVGTSTEVIPTRSRTLVTAIVADWSSTDVVLQRWSRTDEGWHAAGPSWPGVIGRTGAAWGAGLHGPGAPAGSDGPIKREGDGKSPAGVFTLTTTFGYAATAPDGAALPYTQVDPSWKCVDDPASRHYNQIVDARTVTVDWSSAEEMRRGDELYAWVVEVAHNARAQRGGGSCIFLHVWGGTGTATAGCTAMAEPQLAALLAQLDPADVPTFVLLPRATYAALAATWDLPTP